MNAVSINDKYALDTGRIYVTGNLFLVGYAWQKGLIPLSEQAIMQAIELNDVAVAWNQEAFRWGRRAAQIPLTIVPPCRSPACRNKFTATATSRPRVRPGSWINCDH